MNREAPRLVASVRKRKKSKFPTRILAADLCLTLMIEKNH